MGRSCYWRTNGRVLVLALLILSFMLVGFLAPVLPIQDPLATDMLNTDASPSKEHWFGTDRSGRDVLSRTLHGARVDFSIAISAAILGMTLGTVLGAIAGYFGGGIEMIIERFAEAVQGFPYILLALTVSLLIGRGVPALIFVIIVNRTAILAKIVRTETKSIKDAGFVRAAICSGRRPLMVVVRHVIPNVFPAILSQFPISCAASIRFIATLSFLGLGVAAPTPEWGSEIRAGSEGMIWGHWEAAGFPGFALLVTVICLTWLGEALEALVTGGRH